MKIKHEHVRILREAVAWAIKKMPPHYRVKLMGDLARYGFGVAPYCEHVETVYIKSEAKDACLDCGKRLDRLKLVKYQCKHKWVWFEGATPDVNGKDVCKVCGVERE